MVTYIVQLQVLETFAVMFPLQKHNEHNKAGAKRTLNQKNHRRALYRVSKDPKHRREDPTVRLHRLIRVFDRRACDFIHFPALWVQVALMLMPKMA